MPGLGHRTGRPLVSGQIKECTRYLNLPLTLVTSIYKKGEALEHENKDIKEASKIQYDQMASMASAVTEITSAEHWSSFLHSSSGGDGGGSPRLAVAFFWAEFHEPSKRGGQMDTVFAALANKFSATSSFAKINVEDCGDVTDLYPAVEEVPTFLFLDAASREVLGTLEGAAPAELAKMIAQHSAAVASSNSSSAADAAPSVSGISTAMKAKLKKLTTSAPIMLFMKGSPDAPKCKFSRAMVALLADESISYGSFDILSSPDVRAQLKVFSGQKTYPQLYKAGKLVGGLDTVKGIREKEGNLSSLSTGTAPQSVVASVPAPTTASAVPGEEEKPVETKEALTARLTKLTTQAQVVLFMKGSPETPRCGFSRKMVALLQKHGVVFKDFDILEDGAVREGLKEFANWPTYPQLWVNGELQGGLDVLNEIAEDAEDDADGGGLRGALGIVDINTRLTTMVNSARVFLFMKGDPAIPRCGFSRKMVALLRESGITEFDTFDVLGDPEVRSGVKSFSDWPTFPQLYVDAEFVGGLDVISEMAEDAEDGLKEELGL